MSWGRSRSPSRPASTPSCCSGWPSPTTANSPASTSTPCPRAPTAAARSGAFRSPSPACASTHQGSANLLDEAIRERDVDVFLAGVAGRSFTDDYWQRILPRLNPRAVVPTHYDNFFRPLGQRLEFVANVQLAELPNEIGAVSRDIELAALPRSDSANGPRVRRRLGRP
jgi:hypothetical protein